MNANYLLKKNPIPVLFVIIASIVFGISSLFGSTVPINLLCEYRSNPLGIEVTQPRLFWQVQSDERDQRQTAYQILVTSSEKLLKQNEGDLWDSGKVASDETVNIGYLGKTLTSGRQCFWKVKVWDKKGKTSGWSTPAKWSMGLLEQSDWRGKWIGLDQGAKTNDFGGAQWIWFSEGNPADRAPVCTRYFRRAFDLPTSGPVRGATIEITVDDQFSLFVNGQEAGKGDGWGNPQSIAIGALLRPGKNVLAVEARNVGNDPNPAGVIAKLKVAFEQGNPLVLCTDENWKSATNAEAGWNSFVFDDQAWATAKKLGEYGSLSWGIVQAADRRLAARYLRREFAVAKKIRRATAYVCGLGLSELYVNGQKISDDVLSPALSEYDQRAFYVTYEVTEQLKRGANAIGVLLGNGRYFAPSSPSGMRTFGYPKLRLQVNIEYTDGTTAQVVSDEHWKLATEGPIRANNEYHGEEYDARMEMPGWNKTGFDDSQWQPVQLVSPGAPVLSAQIGEPIRVLQAMRPIAITSPKPGMYVYDLGQNIAGWCRLKVSGPAGTVVKLRHAETLKPDGTIFTANLRTAKAEDSYTLKGKGVETYEPRLTHHGFRYVEVTGFPGTPKLDAIEGQVVHDALAKAGEFSTSHPLLNQIYRNIYWTTRDNYRSMPTDMPRDERQGWMGDRQEVSKGETYLFNIAPVYRQWLTDIQDGQRADGSVSDVNPPYWPLYQDGMVWASAYVIIPHMLYDQYGDQGALRQHYGSMKKWTDYMAKFLENDIMPRNTYGDWCVPPGSLTEIHSSDPKRATSGPLMSTAIYYHNLRLMARSARLLGKPADAGQFESLAARIKVAFHQRFYNSALGCYDNGTQTSCVLPLAFGLVSEDCKARVFGHLVKKITVECDNHIGTGLIGGHYLMRVLSDHGRPDLAYTLATQTTYPSWGYMISKGATTMWELWNGDTAAPEMNSANIVMLIGDLNIWLHEYLGGIRPATPGFKKIIIKPEVMSGLDWVKVSYDSIQGRIGSEWRQSAGRFDLKVTIPANTTATVYLPTKDVRSVTEGGQALPKVIGVKSVKMEADRALLEVGSGSYHFVSRQ